MKMSKRGKRLAIFGSISIVMIGYFVITLVSHVSNYFSLKQEEANLKNQLVNLQEEKEYLKVEIEKLNDPEYVAKFAKENYLYSTDGEYIIKLDNNTIENEEIEDNNFHLIYVASGVVLLTGIFLFIKKRT